MNNIDIDKTMQFSRKTILRFRFSSITPPRDIYFIFMGRPLIKLFKNGTRLTSIIIYLLNMYNR